MISNTLLKSKTHYHVTYHDIFHSAGMVPQRHEEESLLFPLYEGELHTLKTNILISCLKGGFQCTFLITT